MNSGLSFDHSHTKDSIFVSRVQTSKAEESGFEKEQIFNRKYILTARINSSSAYELHLGSVLGSRQQQKVKADIQILRNEAHTLHALKGKEEVDGIPRLYWYGTEDSMNVMVCELTGPNLSVLMRACNKAFTLKTTLMLGEQMLRRIEYIHSKGFLHRDISPQNFCIGVLENSHKVYLTNFEYSKAYKNSKTGQHRAYAENREVVGSYIFNSINCQLGIEPSRRDDLEALGYTLIYLCRGSLPWQGIKGHSKKEKWGKVLDRKMALPLESLCTNLPEGFITYMNYCKGLKYDEKPDYRYLFEIFRRTMQRNRYEYDNCFDWVNQQARNQDNSTHEFGDLSISFRTTTYKTANTAYTGSYRATETGYTGSYRTGDTAYSSLLSRHYLKSRATQFHLEYDQFSLQEEETTSSVPVDVSITRLNDLRIFPSKRSMIPGSSPRKQKYRVQRSLSESDELTKRDEHFSRAFKALRTTIKTIGANNDETLKFRRIRTEGAIVKTISLKIPDLMGSRDRSTEFNIMTYADEEMNNDWFSDEKNNEDFEGKFAMTSNDNKRNKGSQPQVNSEKILFKKGREQVWQSESSSDVKENETPDSEIKKGCSMF